MDNIRYKEKGEITALKNSEGEVVTGEDIKVVVRNYFEKLNKGI